MAQRHEASAATLAAVTDAFNAHDLDAIMVAGDLGVSEWLLTGTRADGQQVRVRGCDHWEFRDGEVVRKDSYRKIVDEQV